LNEAFHIFPELIEDFLIGPNLMKVVEINKLFQFT